MIHYKLDEWAFDLEQEFKINPNRKLRNKIIKLHRLRDKYFMIYEKNHIKGRYLLPRYCPKRFVPPPNPVKQPKLKGECKY